MRCILCLLLAVMVVAVDHDEHDEHAGHEDEHEHDHGHGGQDVDVLGAGSTLVCDLVSDLYEDFGTHGSYDCVGSSSGKAKVFNGEVMYAVSEYPLTSDEAAQYGVTSLPFVASEVAIVFNLPSISRLVVSPNHLGDIFTGKMTTWNHPSLAALNKAILPNEKIQVVARSGGSGTTYMLLDTLERFGSVARDNVSARFCDAVGDVCDRLNYITVPKTSDVVEAVKNTPYSIGYVGVKTAISNNLPFAGVYLNGVVQLPTVDSDTATLDGLIPDYAIPTELPHSGYPFEGLAYIIYREQTATSETCDEVQSVSSFIQNIYSKQSSSPLYGANWVMPMTPSAINLITEKLLNWEKVGMSSCGHSGHDHVVPVWGPLSKSYYYQKHIAAYSTDHENVRVSVTEALMPSSDDDHAFRGVELLQLPLRDLLNGKFVLNTGADSEFIFGIRELTFVSHQSENSFIPIRMSLEVMRAIVNGTIRNWENPNLATHQNAYTGIPSSGAIRFVIGDSYRTIINILADILELPVTAMKYEVTTVSELNDLLETDGRVITCVDLDRMPTGVNVIIPTIDDDERAPFRFRTTDFVIRHSEPLVTTHQEAIYPFSYAMIHRLPRELSIDNDNYNHVDEVGEALLVDLCDEHILREVFPFVSFSSIHGGIVGAKETTDIEMAKMKCNGDFLFPKSSSFNTIIVIVPTAVGIVLLMVAIIGYFKRKLFKSKGEIEYLIDNNKLAVEIAESIADMRLEDIAWISEIEDPDKLQECFGKIITNLFEYRRYLPDTILYQSDSGESRASLKYIEPPSDDSSVTIVFTDVQESTSLWDAASEAMAAALRIHHSVIREVIKECDGYEVKTIGDAFMVAFRTPIDAVKFGVLAQQRLLSADWPPCITGIGLCQTRCTQQGQKLWSGLRVRMGIHCGAVNSEEDVITCRKDYYGPTVNKASRVESQSEGGIVMISEEVYKAIQSSLPSMDVKIQSAGDYELKGITGQHSLYSLVPSELEARLAGSAQPTYERRVTMSSASSGTKVVTKMKLAAHFKSVVGSVIFAELKHSKEIMSPASLNSVCTSFVDISDIAAERYDGTIHTHFGNGLLIGFNTGGKQCLNFIQSACRCVAFIASRELTSATLRVGMTAGTFATGNVGARKRTATLSSPHVNIANMLCLTANELGATALFADLPDCPSISNTVGVSGVVRPLMKWTIDNSKVAVIHELNLELFDDWAFTSSPHWGQSSSVAGVFDEAWKKRQVAEVMDMSGFLKLANQNPTDLVLGRIARIPAVEYFNMYRLVKAAVPEHHGSMQATPLSNGIIRCNLDCP